MLTIGDEYLASSMAGNKKMLFTTSCRMIITHLNEFFANFELLFVMLTSLDIW